LNVKCVFDVLKQLEAVLLKYGDWVADTCIGLQYKDRSTFEKEGSTTLILAGASSNDDLFEAIADAI
jgi:hypothetical protein